MRTPYSARLTCLVVLDSPFRLLVRRIGDVQPTLAVELWTVTQRVCAGLYVLTMKSGLDLTLQRGRRCFATFVSVLHEPSDEEGEIAQTRR
jgi:hypothetical protein